MTLNQPTTSVFMIFVRIFWMGLGPMTLLVISLKIISEGGGWFTPAGIAILTILGGLPLALGLSFVEATRKRLQVSQQHRPIFGNMWWE